MTTTNKSVAFPSKNAKILAAAVTAGLIKTLKGIGAFTVFAPDENAFAAIQNGLDNLLKPENKADLINVLMCHVTVGKVMAATFKDGQELITVNGTKLKVSIIDGKTKVAGATIILPDVPASNGVIHVMTK